MGKLASSFSNLSPFIATIIFAAYFINNKYYLLGMIFIAQLLSDITHGFYLSNLTVYIAYFLIIIVIYNSMNNVNIFNSLWHALYANLIFYLISNIGHFIVFSETYTFISLLNNYHQSIPFTFNLLVSTIFFIILFHALLTIYKRWLAKGLREI